MTRRDDRLDRTGYRRVLEDAFDGGALDAGTWLPYHLPHWSSRRAAAARFEVRDCALRLRIDADQPPSCPEFDGELRARALADPDCMVALWMIGVEDSPERSGEICVCEILGRDVAPDHALIGMGVHPFGDPTLIDDFEKVRVDVDARDVHEYAAEWTPDRVRFYVDERL